MSSRNLFSRIIEADEAGNGIELDETEVALLMSHCAGAIDKAANESRGVPTTRERTPETGRQQSGAQG